MANRTYEDIAKEAVENFRAMTDKMASIANGNDKEWSKHWPSEEGLFPPIYNFLQKNNQLIKEFKEMNND